MPLAEAWPQKDSQLPIGNPEQCHRSGTCRRRRPGPPAKIPDQQTLSPEIRPAAVLNSSHLSLLGIWDRSL
jgi:hypothetical protein